MRLLVRADASAGMGAGHVIRCLALAEEWIASGGQVDFASVDLPPRLQVMLENAGVVVRMLGTRPGSPDISLMRNTKRPFDTSGAAFWCSTISVMPPTTARTWY